MSNEEISKEIFQYKEENDKLKRKIEFNNSNIALLQKFCKHEDILVTERSLGYSTIQTQYCKTCAKELQQIHIS